MTGKERGVRSKGGMEGNLELSQGAKKKTNTVTFIGRKKKGRI